MITDLGKHRLVAFYLPQYHPIPENDLWWGKGFTEWVNVTRSQPLFRGHYQPHIPADLGFYDLRLPESRQAQADLAREYGIHGFCYYHYWFNGKLMLERPFDEVLSSGKPEFPFCLCWVNENWTRRWSGKDTNVLMHQEYSQADDLHHFNWLLKAFRDPRYITVKGKPLFLVYAAQHMPNPLLSSEMWRKEARKAGLPGLYLCSIESYRTKPCDPIEIGFDAALDFHPNTMKYKARISKVKRIYLAGIHKLWHKVWQLYDYPSYIKFVLEQPDPGYKRYPCVMPSWDNTARRYKAATVFVNSDPIKYQQWLTYVLQKFQQFGEKEDFIFINAWNEWAEGNHLEPCLKWGRGYLEATRAALLYKKNSLNGDY